MKVYILSDEDDIVEIFAREEDANKMKDTLLNQEENMGIWYFINEHEVLDAWTHT